MTHPKEPAVGSEIDELDELSRKADLQEGKWQKGVAGNSNLVAYNGEDVVGVGAIFSEARLEFIAALVNYWRNGGSQVARDGERDKARLDWLDTHPFTMYRERDPGTGTMHHVCLVDENKKPRTGIVNIKVRTAIDAAMSQQEKRDG